MVAERLSPSPASAPSPLSVEVSKGGALVFALAGLGGYGSSRARRFSGVSSPLRMRSSLA